MNTETNWILRFVDEITKPLQQPKLALDNLDGAVADVAASFDDVEAATKNVSNVSAAEFEAVKDDLKATELDVENLTKELNDLKLKLKETGKDTEVISGNFEEFSKMMEALPFTSATAGLASVRTGIASVTKAGLAFIATPLGATMAALAAVGLVANEFLDYNNAAYEANQVTQQITHTTGDLLDQNRLHAQSIEATFGSDYKDTLTIARNQVKAFGVEYGEAFSVIEDGLIAGGAADSEFLDSMREYPKLFAKNGFSIQEFQRIINTGIDAGVYSDKLPDAIKEFSLSVTEQTQSSRDALENAFGKTFTDTLFAGIRDGSVSPREALEKIGDETERIGVNAVDAQVLTADLFRGAGEDAGGFLEIMELTNTALGDEKRQLTDIEQYLSDVTAANRELAIAKDNALSSDSMVEFSGNMSLFWTQIKTDWYNDISYVTELFNSFSEGFIIKQTQIGMVISMTPGIFKQAFMDVSKEMGDVLLTFGSFGDIIEDVLTLNFDDAKEGISQFTKDFKKEVSDVGGVGTTVVDKYKQVWEFTGTETKDFLDTKTKGALALNELKKQQKKQQKKLLEGGGSTDPNNPFKPTATPKVTGASGNGGGGNAITMNLTVTNNFNVKNGADIMARKNELIDMIVSGINNRVKDGLIAATI